jgi:hypothetical protein
LSCHECELSSADWQVGRAVPENRN